jgi:hypothetical protein
MILGKFVVMLRYSFLDSSSSRFRNYIDYHISSTEILTSNNIILQREQDVAIDSLASFFSI